MTISCTCSLPEQKRGAEGAQDERKRGAQRHPDTISCWDEADGIVSRAVGRGLDKRDLSGLRRIGSDEKAELKGQLH